MEKIDAKKSFGVSVKTWRRELGFSQEELAERANLHRTYISDVERGARNLSLESITRLAHALEVSVATLFPDERNVGVVTQPLVNILLVEDNADDVALTRHAFKQARFANQMAVVSDGAEALDYLFLQGQYASRSPADLPELILLDLNLPKVSGLEVLRRLKTDSRTVQVHTVILTTSDQPSDLKECRALGADFYIVKPVDFKQLSEVTPKLKLNWALLRADVT